MHQADRIRNVALVGHRGSGKTSLNEALLFQAGAVNRLGSVVDGTTVSDADPDEQARQMSISASLSSFEWDGPQDQPPRHARRAELRRRRARRAARLRVGDLRGQRRHGRRGRHHAPVGARRRARPRAHDLREHARPRAGRLLPHAGLAEGAPSGPHVVATEIPIGVRARGPRRHRPRRHEGLRVRRRTEPRQLPRDPDPRRAARAGARSTARSSWTRSPRSPTR